MANQSITYVNQGKYLISAEKENYNGAKTLEYGCALEDIAQAHYFTMQVSQIPITYDHPKFGAFLPVKSANFTYVGFDNMSIPVGVYGNLTLMRRKSVGRLSLSLYDNDRDQVEKGIRNWVNNCFPNGGMYVNYLSNIWAELDYNSYTTKGTLNSSLKYMVIPAENYQVSRDYEAGGAKLINFGLVVIGEAAKMSSVVELEKDSNNNDTITNSMINAVNRDTINPARAAINKNTPSWESKNQPIQIMSGISKDDASKTHLPTNYNIITPKQ